MIDPVKCVRNTVQSRLDDTEWPHQGQSAHYILSGSLILPCANPSTAHITPRSLLGPSDPTSQVPQALQSPSPRTQPDLHSLHVEKAPWGLGASYGVRVTPWLNGTTKQDIYLLATKAFPTTLPGCLQSPPHLLTLN